MNNLIKTIFLVGPHKGEDVLLFYEYLSFREADRVGVITTSISNIAIRSAFAMIAASINHKGNLCKRVVCI